MENEIWKDAVGYEGIYQVSNMGRVRSVDRFRFNKGNNTTHLIKGKVLKPNKCKGGYPYVGLRDGKGIRTSTVKIHRMVAFAFCPGYCEGLEVNHKDGIRHNNEASNLEWVTRSENMRDAYKRPQKNRNGEQAFTAKLLNRDIGIIASLYDYGVSQTIIAKAYGVSQGTISHVITNKHYRNGLIDAGLALPIND